jgi:hypothetical protein
MKKYSTDRPSTGTNSCVRRGGSFLGPRLVKIKSNLVWKNRSLQKEKKSTFFFFSVRLFLFVFLSLQIEGMEKKNFKPQQTLASMGLKNLSKIQIVLRNKEQQVACSLMK